MKTCKVGDVVKCKWDSLNLPSTYMVTGLEIRFGSMVMYLEGASEVEGRPRTWFNPDYFELVEEN